MRRVLAGWWMVTLLLAAPGCFTAPAECGPNPCGACRSGCTAMDTCVDGEWTCACDCPDCCSGQCGPCEPDGGSGVAICSEHAGVCVLKCYCVR